MVRISQRINKKLILEIKQRRIEKGAGREGGREGEKQRGRDYVFTLSKPSLSHSWAL